MPTIDIEGQTVDYADHGSGACTVLLHCSASTYHQWHLLIGELARTGRVIAPNLFGYGRTSPWRGEQAQTVMDHAAMVRVLLDRVLEGTERVDLVGHSFGAVVALDLALLLGRRAGRMVLFEPNPFAILSGGPHAAALHEVLSMRGTVAEALDGGDPWPGAAAFTDYFAGDGTWAALPDARRRGLASDLAANIHEWDAVLDDRLVPGRWQAVAAGVLLVSAANTRPALHAVVRTLLEHNPAWHAETLARGHHMAPITRARDFNSCVLGFLKPADLSSVGK